MERTNHAGTDVAGDLLMGAIAGVAGVWALDRLDWFLMDREPERARRQTRLARPDGQDPAHVIANTAARGGNAAVAGAAAPCRHRRPLWPRHDDGGRLRGAAVGAGRGIPFGLAMFVLQDEGLNTLLGTGGPLGRYPWQTHARGAAAHALFGFVTDSVLRLLPKPRD